MPALSKNNNFIIKIMNSKKKKASPPKVEIKHPINYVSVPLDGFKGSATFEGQPSAEALELVNELAKRGYNKIFIKEGN
jgi:hypothetical protein